MAQRGEICLEKLSGPLIVLDRRFMAAKEEAGPGEVVPNLE
jgi:hypothetical protein